MSTGAAVGQPCWTLKARGNRPQMQAVVPHKRRVRDAVVEKMDKRK